MKSEQLAKRHIVLLGVGHTNAHIVRMWGMQAFADTSLTCVSDQPIATYSGMLPAMLAGQVTETDMEIDLVKLCSSVGARLILDRVHGINHARQEILFENRPPIPYDVLSVGIGSVPSVANVEIHSDLLLKIKPMQSFVQRLQRRVEDILSRTNEHRQSCPRIVVVGSGVAGIEILFCISAFLSSHGIDDAQMHLVTRSAKILNDATSGTRRRVLSEIRRRGHSISTKSTVTRVDETGLTMDNGERLDADIVIWATGATAPPTLSRLELPLDERGFLLTDRTLQSVSGKPIFAVGDTGTIRGEKVAKAGVYAVRQGPILWENMGRLMNGLPLIEYKPQRSFLRLINLGDGRAIGQWKSFSWTGRSAMWLKEQIDTKFIAKYHPKPMIDASQPMQCRGCGCKLSAKSLSTVVGTLNDSLTVELEDAANIGGSDDSQLVASTDFFSSPFDDAYLSGRVAAYHSASDILATGSRVTEALANVVVPEGNARSQQRLLHDFMAGASHEFRKIGGRIVGGHTIVGPRMEAGFTVIGKRLGEQLLRKSNLQAGDQLYLTKPLGIGVLLAAHTRSACDARDYCQLVTAMLQSQAQYSNLAIASNLIACTDITGFGLAGHLLEMLQSSHQAATICLNLIPNLDGAVQAVTNGIESSLIDDNLTAELSIAVADHLKTDARYRLLFDPQTCGGLLFGVSIAKEQEFLNRCTDAGLKAPTCIGEVHTPNANQPPLIVVA